MFYEMVALCVTEKVWTCANWLVSAKSTLKSSRSFDSCSNGRRFFIHFEWISLAVCFFLFLKPITLATRMGGDLFSLLDRQPFDSLIFFPNG